VFYDVDDATLVDVRGRMWFVAGYKEVAILIVELTP
jgi:hypothetical protein